MTTNRHSIDTCSTLQCVLAEVTHHQQWNATASFLARTLLLLAYPVPVFKYRKIRREPYKVCTLANGKCCCFYRPMIGVLYLLVYILLDILYRWLFLSQIDQNRFYTVHAHIVSKLNDRCTHTLVFLIIWCCRAHQEKKIKRNYMLSLRHA